MKLTDVEFLGSFAALEQLPKNRMPEIAFAGRSNVGKSSLINRLLNRKNIARTSNTPGKTRLLNLVRVNKSFDVVDLPGYGFAKVSRQEQIRWQRMIEQYITGSNYLRGVVCLIDSRHGPLESDIELLEWLAAEEIPQLVVGTKVDKLTQKQFSTARKRIGECAERLQSGGPVYFSAVTGQGKAELWHAIMNVLE